MNRFYLQEEKTGIVVSLIVQDHSVNIRLES